MTILFRRAVRLTVAGLVIEEGLRLNFELERSIDATQDRGTVKIYNLSEEHSARIEERGRAVTLEAGYLDGAGLAVLFVGEAQRVRAGRDRLAHIVTIDIGDQVRQKNRLGGVYSDSLAGPVSVRRIAQRIIAAMELAPGPLDNIPADATFTNWHEGGSRPASASLTTLLATVDCTWFEEDGLIRINRVGMGQVDAPSLTTSPQTGLIETPRPTDQGLELRMFLEPRVRIGAALTIEGVEIDRSGPWKIVSIRHKGDSWSGPFETALDMREFEGAATS